MGAERFHRQEEPWNPLEFEFVGSCGEGHKIATLMLFPASITPIFYVITHRILRVLFASISTTSSASRQGS
jgi:hypothetical protein